MSNNSLTFDTLRRANLARVPEFRDKHGRLAHTEPDGSDWTPAQWLQAVVGELGEYANVRKKFERGDITQMEFFQLAASELADVATYLDLLAYQLGIDLGVAIMNKWNEVSARVDCALRITSGTTWGRITKEEHGHDTQKSGNDESRTPREHRATGDGVGTFTGAPERADGSDGRDPRPHAEASGDGAESPF